MLLPSVSARLLLALIGVPLVGAALTFSVPSRAEGRCPDGYFPIGGGDAGWEGCAPMGGDDEGDEEGDGPERGDAASMRYFSPEEWRGFFEHSQRTEAQSQRERALMGERYRRLQAGMWFFPGEEPFAGWSTAPNARASRPARRADPNASCTASFWTLDGAVIASTVGGRDGVAVISYMGHSIPAPTRNQYRRIALTQSGRTQTVRAWVSSVGTGRRRMGMVTFTVPSGNILVGAIEDVQDYSLADNGRTIFSGQWHDGLQARAALARCLSQQR